MIKIIIKRHRFIHQNNYFETENVFKLNHYVKYVLFFYHKNPVLINMNATIQ